MKDNTHRMDGFSVLWNDAEDLRECLERSLDRELPKSGRSGLLFDQAMHDSVFPGGQRLRPRLTFLAAELCGGLLP